MRRIAMALLMAVIPVACCHRPPHAPRVEQAPQPTTVQGAAETPVLITREFKDEPMLSVLEYIARGSGHRIELNSEVKERVTVDLQNCPWREALETVANLTNCVLEEKGEVVHVSRPPRLTMEFKRRNLVEVINQIAKEAGANVVIDPDVKGEVTMRFSDVPWLKALDAVVKTSGYTLIEEDRGRIIRVADPAKLPLRMETRIFVFNHIHPDEYYKAKIETGGFGLGRGEAQGRFTLLDALRNALTRSPHSTSTIGKLDYDKVGNMILVVDSKAVLDRFAQIIKELDVAPSK